MLTDVVRRLHRLRASVLEAAKKSCARPSQPYARTVLPLWDAMTGEMRQTLSTRATRSAQGFGIIPLLELSFVSALNLADNFDQNSSIGS